MSGIGGKYGNINAYYGNATYDDTTDPSILITSSDVASDGYTNSSPISYTATFSEIVYNFTASDFALTNGIISSLTGSGTSYAFQVTPSAQGLVSVQIVGTDINDGSGNPAVSSTYSFVYDTIRPTVTLASSDVVQDGYQNEAFYSFTVTFVEAGSGINSSTFTASDISVTNGYVTDLVGSGNSWTFSLIPSDQGHVEVTIPEDRVYDKAGNHNEQSNVFSFIHDTIRPSVTISGAQNGLVFDFTAVFADTLSRINESTFIASDISVTNGYVSSLSGSDHNWSFTVVPSDEGSLSVQIPANRVADNAGNLNTASNVVNLIHDTTRPSVVLSSSDVSSGQHKNLSSYSIVVSFIESGNGINSSTFTAGDISVTNGAASSLSGSGNSWTFTLTPSDQGPVSVVIPENGISDLSGNLNTGSNTISFVYDSIGPSVVVASTSVANDGYQHEVHGYNFTATFSDGYSNITDASFTASDISVTNGSVSSLTGSNYNWDFVVYPSDEGLVTVQIPAGRVLDEAGNSNSASNIYSFTHDTVRPVVVFSSSDVVLDGYKNSATSYAFLATFTEATSGIDGSTFEASDITVINGHASSLSGSGNSWTFTLTPSDQGVVSVFMSANKVYDLSGNSNLTSAVFTFTHDTLRPSVTIASADVDNNDYQNESSYNFTATFSEFGSLIDSSTFEASDISVTNGSASSLSGSGNSWTFVITPSDQGVVSVQLPEGMVADRAGNTNTASNVYSFTHDTIRPTVELSTSDAVLDGYENGASYLFAVTFTEAGSAIDRNTFNSSDVSVTNGSVSGLNGSGNSWFFTVTPSDQGLVSIQLPADRVSDRAGNTNTASNIYSFTHDTVRPSITLTSSDIVSGISAYETITITASFSETVYQFTASDIGVSGGTLSNFTPVSGSVYQFDVASLGIVTITIGQDSAFDIAGNGNVQSTLYYTYDITSPVPTLSSSDVAYNGFGNSNTYEFIVTFAETQSGINNSTFTVGDLSVTNGAASSLSGSGNSWTFTVTPDFDGVVSVQLPAGRVSDTAGNTNVASNTFSFTHDQARPTVTISSPDVTNGGFSLSNPILLDIVFSESVSGFEVGDLTLVNCTARNFQGSGTTYSVEIIPTVSLISIEIPENVATDVAGNYNFGSGIFSAILRLKTKVSQSDQFLGSYTYDDQLSQASAEMQPDSNIANNLSVVAATTSSFVIVGDLLTLGVNKSDQLTITNNNTYAGLYEILDLSYNSGNNKTTVTVDSSTLTANSSISATGSIDVDSAKGLQSDLNHIRTQLRKLGKPSGNWYDDPALRPINSYRSSIQNAVVEGTAIDVGYNFIAGAPYDLKVFLNGQLLLANIVENGTVTTYNDYLECDIDGNIVNPGSIARTIKVNIDLYAGDILHFVWNKIGGTN